MLGFLDQETGSPTDAIAAYDRALALFQSLGEKENVAITQHLLAESLESLGQSTEAWKHRYQALAWIPAAASEDQISTVLDIVEIWSSEAAVGNPCQRLISVFPSLGRLAERLQALSEQVLGDRYVLFLAQRLEEGEGAIVGSDGVGR